MTRQQFTNYLTYFILFLLPWQARFIVATPTLQGGEWEYGVMGLYLIEVLILLAVALRGRPEWIDGSWRVRKATTLFLGGIFFSVAFSLYFHLSLFTLLHIMMALFLFGLLVDRRVCTKKIVGSFLAGLVLPSALAWWQVVTGGSGASTLLGLSAQNAEVLGTSVIEVGGERILRGYGSFSHPNIFGGYLAVGLLFFSWLSFKHEHMALKSLKFAVLQKIKEQPIIKPLLEKWGSYSLQLVAMGAGIAIFASTLVITFSRSAWLGLVAGICVVGFFHILFKRKIHKKALRFGAIGFAALLITLLIFSGPVLSRFNPEVPLEARSIEERIGGYAWVDDIVSINVFTGVGAGGYTAALSIVDPGHESYLYQPVHNTFALMFSELGMIGFAFFIIWFVSIDLTNYRTVKKLGGMFGMGLGLTILVLALFDHYPWSNWSGLALMAVSFGLMLRWGLEAKKT
jgi:hypothetical protein